MARKGRDPSYYRVRVEGRFHHAKERYLYTVSDGDSRLGCHHPARDGRRRHGLVDRGFVPDELKDPRLASAGTGRERGRPSPASCGRPRCEACSPPTIEPAANRWFWRDLQGMARSAFPAGIIQVAPFFVEAEKSRRPRRLARRRPDPARNPRITISNMRSPGSCWRSALLVIYGVYVRGVYRRDHLARLGPVAGDRADR